jgi:hypothetical protein
LKLSVNTDKQTYTKRDKVSLTFETDKILTDSILPNLAVAIIDDNDIQPDTMTNILAEILLASELKGRIDNPAFYLQLTNEAELAADLLMLTHGWRRYDMPATMRGKFQMPETLPELSQSIAGHVRKGAIINSDAVGTDIQLLSYSGNGKSSYNFVKTDSAGNFLFDGFEMPDSSYFALQALNKKGKKGTLELSYDTVRYPETNEYLPIPFRALQYSNLHSLSLNEDVWVLKNYVQKADINILPRTG